MIRGWYVIKFICLVFEDNRLMFVSCEKVPTAIQVVIRKVASRRYRGALSVHQRSGDIITSFFFEMKRPQIAFFVQSDNRLMAECGKHRRIMKMSDRTSGNSSSNTSTPLNSPTQLQMKLTNKVDVETPRLNKQATTFEPVIKLMNLT